MELDEDDLRFAWYVLDEQDDGSDPEQITWALGIHEQHVVEQKLEAGDES